MSLPRRGPSTVPAGSQLQAIFNSRDAWRAAMFATLVLAAAATIRLATTRSLPAALQGTYQIEIGLCALLLTILLLARRQVRPKLFLTLALALVAAMSVVHPFAVAQWTRFGRPFEAFWSLHVFIFAAALVVPRWSVLSLMVLLVAAGESPLMLAIARHLGAPTERLPLGEPYVSYACALASIALVFLAARRRALVLRYLTKTSEKEAARGLVSTSETIDRQLDESLRQLEELLAALPPTVAQETTSQAMRSALGKLGAVRLKVGAFPATEAVEQERRPSPAPTRDEAQFYARDGQNSALTMAAICAVSGAVASQAQGVALPESAMAYALVSALGVLVGALLWRDRDRPSRRRSAIFVCGLIASVVLAFILTTYTMRISPVGTFLPGTAAMLLIATLPLLLPWPRWLLLLIEGLLVAGGIAIYYLLRFDLLRDRISFVHPWDVFLYVAIAVQLFTQDEYRRSTSLRLLRTEAELAGLTRRVGLFCALRDQVSTPLQVLMLGLAQLAQRGVVDAARSDELAKALATIAARWPGPEELAHQALVPLSFDSAAVLQPR